MRSRSFLGVIFGIVVAVAVAVPPARGVTAAPFGDVTGTHLRVVTHDLDSVSSFDEFRYQTGTVVALGTHASARADRALAAAVRRTLDTAQSFGDFPCSGEASDCGYLEQRLRERPCVPDYVCVAQSVGFLPPGANDGEAWVDTIAFDAKTGQPAKLSQFINAEHRSAFVDAVNARIQRVLAAGGLGSDPYWAKPVTLSDIRSWLPEPDGMHIWFAKFGVAPGSFGVVRTVIPWDAITRAGTG